MTNGSVSQRLRLGGLGQTEVRTALSAASGISLVDLLLDLEAVELRNMRHVD